MTKRTLFVLSEWGCWGEEYGRIMVEVLERGLRRYGW
jgi:hypothetical protein